jgi:hypothetical protein
MVDFLKTNVEEITQEVQRVAKTKGCKNCARMGYICDSCARKFEQENY